MQAFLPVESTVLGYYSFIDTSECNWHQWELCLIIIGRANTCMVPLWHDGEDLGESDHSCLVELQACCYIVVPAFLLPVVQRSCFSHSDGQEEYKARGNLPTFCCSG